MKCKNCGKEINDNVLYCSKCFSALTIKKCKKCENIVKTDAKFCSKCGTELIDENDYLIINQEEKTSASTSIETYIDGNKYLVILIAGALLFVGLSLIYSASGILATRIKYPELTEISGELYNSFLGIIQMVYCIPLIGMFIYAFRKDLKRDFIDFKQNSGNHFKVVALGIAGCLVLTYVVSYIYMILGIEGDSENQETINSVLQSKGWMPMVISVIFIAPFTEEMLFRKSIYGTCKYKFKIPDAITIGIITIIFALVHVASIENLKYIFQYLPLAFVITYSYHNTKNIYVPMAIHFLNNLLSVLMLYLSIYLGV